MNLAICDDQKEIRDSLKKMVMQSNIFELQPVKISLFSSSADILESIEMGVEYDIILLDIGLGDNDGVQTAREIRKRYPASIIIFVTAYDSYIREVFEVQAFDFLSKPVDASKLERTLRRASHYVNPVEVYRYTFRKANYQILLRDIVCFISNARTITILMRDGSSNTYYDKLDVVEKKLGEFKEHFLRIHKSYLVNLNYIKQYEYDKIILTTGQRLDISRERQNQVRKQYMNIRGI